MIFLRDTGVSSTSPVIIMTDSDSPLELENAKQNGVGCYLIKPMTFEEMDQMTKALKKVLLGRGPVTADLHGLQPAHQTSICSEDLNGVEHCTFTDPPSQAT